MNTRYGRIHGMATMAAVFAVFAWANCGFAGEKKGKAKGEMAKGHPKAEIGEPAPDFTLKDQDGKEHKLSELKGKIVVLEWTNHECPFVNRYYDQKTIPKTYESLKDKNVAWMAIDSSHFCMDKVEEIRTWAEKQSLPYPILMDPEGKVGRMYGARTTPHMFVIDAKGVLAYMGSVDDDPHGDKENTRNFVEEAVNALSSGTAVAVATTKSFGCSVKYKKD